MTDLCLGCDREPCICLEVHESEFDMNKNLATAVHATKLVLGQNYILDHLFGKGVQVEVVLVDSQSVLVRIVNGFMQNTLSKQKWNKGDELPVMAKSAKFYEVQV